MKMSALDRVLLLLTGLLAAYQVVVGIDSFSTLPIVVYTIAFGVLLLAGLLLIILGFEALDSPVVVIASTVIPLAMSLGLVWQHADRLRAGYLVFALLGFLAIVATRVAPVRGRLPVVVLAVVHGIAGLVIFLLPLLLALSGAMRPGFALVGLGGGLIGVGGLLLSFLKTGRPILARETILRILPGLLFTMTACFVAGFLGG